MKVCKESQEKCMALKEAAKQNACMHAAIKELQEKVKNLDFCDQAPSHMAQKCKDEQKKCMASSSVKAEQQACWDAKMKELERQTNRGSGSGSSSKDGDSMDNAWANAFGDCPVLKKFIEANKGKDGSLNVKMNPEQAKPLCAEFKSTSSKCRTHAVVGKLLGGVCASSNKHGSGKGSGYGSGSGGHEGFCSQAPSSLMKVCKEAQDKCKGSKVAAQQKLCMDAAIKRLQEMAKNLDFCGQAPSHMAQKCKDEQKKCETSSSDKAKQKACWDAKMKELMAEANRGSGSGSGSSMDVCAIALNAVCVCPARARVCFVCVL